MIHLNRTVAYSSNLRLERPAMASARPRFGAESDESKASLPVVKSSWSFGKVIQSVKNRLMCTARQWMDYFKPNLRGSGIVWDLVAGTVIGLVLAIGTPVAVVTVPSSIGLFAGVSLAMRTLRGLCLVEPNGFNDGRMHNPSELTDVNACEKALMRIENAVSASIPTEQQEEVLAGNQALLFVDAAISSQPEVAAWGKSNLKQLMEVDSDDTVQDVIDMYRANTGK